MLNSNRDVDDLVMLNKIKKFIPVQFLIGLSVLLCSGMSLSADARSPQMGSVNRLKTEVSSLELTYKNLSNSFLNRRGLLSEADAQGKYEQAVFHYLLQEYEEAALIFFTLVESDALSEVELRTDSEWYLAHSTFLMGNYSISSDVLYLIVENGEAHPFYEDAVRTLLELYGITRNTRMFQRTYERFILSGRVTATDKVNYSIGKSLFWQGENARAKSILNSLSITSTVYHQSRYFIGGILASEGDYTNAIEEFQKSKTVPLLTSADKELQDLSILALGRVYLENKQYDEAISAYQELPNRSKYAPDQLFELSWCFILKGSYLDALRIIEVFLIAYPDDEKALSLRIIQGNLYVNIDEYEQSLVSYERVIRQLSPIQRHLREIHSSESKNAEFFQALVEDDRDFIDGFDLPSYAFSVLQTEDGINRAVSLNRELNIQDNDIVLARTILGEVTAVMSGDGSIGIFQQGHAELGAIRERCITILIQSLETEIDYLNGNSSPSDLIRLQTIESRLGLLKGDFDDSSSITDQNADIMQSHRDQVREVQLQAYQIQQIADSILQKGLELKSSMRYHELSGDEQEYITELLNQLETDATTASTDLKKIQTEEVLLKIMATVPLTEFEIDINPNENLYENLLAMHKELKPIWNNSTLSIADKDILSSQINDSFLRTEDVYLQIDEAVTTLQFSERRERVMLSALLKEQKGAVTALESEIVDINQTAKRVGLEVATLGFVNLEKEITTNILDADSGIVRIYWQRKSDVEDEITRLNQELSDRKKELRSKFEFIESKLSEEE